MQRFDDPTATLGIVRIQVIGRLVEQHQLRKISFGEEGQEIQHLPLPTRELISTTAENFRAKRAAVQHAGHMLDRARAQRIPPHGRVRAHRGKGEIFLRSKTAHDTAIGALVHIRDAL
jgi:hypothetical protein